MSPNQGNNEVAMFVENDVLLTFENVVHGLRCHLLQIPFSTTYALWITRYS